MSTVFFIDGGIGRIIASIPALLKYQKNHPNEEWYIVVPAWDYVFLGIPELQERVFSNEFKGVFKQIFFNAKDVISPEPYRLPEYYRQEISLVESFDKIINQTDDHSDLIYTNLKVSNQEIRFAKEIIFNITQGKSNKKRIVINPFGSTCGKCPLGIFDDSNRSISQKTYLRICEELSKDYDLIYFGKHELSINEDTYTYKIDPDPDMRTWIALINDCDYFIGCDTSGQHIARSLNKPGTVILGGTHEKNVSYEDHFQIIKKEQDYHYSPMRISNLDSNLAERLMEDSMNFNDEEIDSLIEMIKEDIKTKTETKENFKKSSNITKSKKKSLYA